ncbi:PRTRC system ThiF family protein [Mucilaginibacter pineti]|uniref:PRTRC system ThiF family protein n=1 Tax=Mucilaginibacter pineti TaxID=1391627 RepID=A0A1G7GDW5_9SPHI|nr:PRTRC system ThiF family protein [Mucilaginibacter pineti]SDE86337.1 PRTRC system ThiF family protein [Mucilaginibacter pineti]
MKTAMHFADNYLINPTNPITVTQIGAGGTGSNMITQLVRINHCLKALGHAGLHVNLWDDDLVTEANLGRQLFAQSEVGLCKSVARINNVNRTLGTNWKAVEDKFTYKAGNKIQQEAVTNLYISCVDTVQARFDLAAFLKANHEDYSGDRDKPLYWLDLGNSKFTGQAILSTISSIAQPKSKKYHPVAVLPMITDEYKDLLEQEAKTESNTPSCSTAEALEKQDLFINPTLANMGGSVLWQLFRNGMTENRGFFLNLNTLRSDAIKVA